MKEGQLTIPDTGQLMTGSGLSKLCGPAGACPPPQAIRFGVSGDATFPPNPIRRSKGIGRKRIRFRAPPSWFTGRARRRFTVLGSSILGHGR